MDNYPKLDADILAHHGILGQKWGKRNGPPYPLSAGKHSSSEKKAGWKKSLGGGRNEQLYDRKTKNEKPSKQSTEVDKSGASVQNETKGKGLRLTSNQKKAIAIGAGIVAAGALTAVVIRSGKFDTLSATGKSIVDRMGAGGSTASFKGSLPKEIKDRFPLRKDLPDYKKDYLGINPTKKADFLLKPQQFASDGFPLDEVNCGACTLAHELKRRGLDVTARLFDTRNVEANKLFSTIYKIPPGETGFGVVLGAGPNFKGLTKTLKKMGTGARGSLLISPEGTGGHYISFEVIGKGPLKKIQLFDPQSEWIFSPEDLKDLYNASSLGVGYIRTDNLELNNIDFIEQLIQARV